MYGNVLETVTLSYGRRYPDSSKLLEPEDHQAQKRTYCLYTENNLTNRVESRDDWLLPLLLKPAHMSYTMFKAQMPLRGSYLPVEFAQCSKN